MRLDRWRILSLMCLIMGQCAITGESVAVGDDSSEEQEITSAPASDDESPALTVTEKWSILVNPAKQRPGIVEFHDKSPIQSLQEFSLTGPMVGHPFGLGEYIVDGRWAGSQGVVQVIEGKNALLSLATADEFELEGILHQEGYGGWLMLLGWNQGHGYSISNVTLKDSGAPWFICEYRGSEAISETNNEIKQFEWRGDQPFFVKVQNKLLTVVVGKTPVAEKYPLDNYTAGGISLGTYDTRYGPRAVKIRSLRIRSAPPADGQPSPLEKAGKEKSPKKPAKKKPPAAGKDSPVE